MKGMICITGIDMVRAVQVVYSLSKPQGMGYMHYVPGELPREEAKKLVREDHDFPVTLDYVKGRACKFHIQRKDGDLWTNDSWYAHSKEDFENLLSILGVDRNK